MLVPKGVHLSSVIDMQVTFRISFSLGVDVTHFLVSEMSPRPNQQISSNLMAMPNLWRCNRLVAECRKQQTELKKLRYPLFPNQSKVNEGHCKLKLLKSAEVQDGLLCRDPFLFQKRNLTHFKWKMSRSKLQTLWCQLGIRTYRFLGRCWSTSCWGWPKDLEGVTGTIGISVGFCKTTTLVGQSTFFTWCKAVCRRCWRKLRNRFLLAQILTLTHSLLGSSKPVVKMVNVEPTRTPKICRGRKGLLYCGLENPQQVAKRGMLVHIQFWIPKTINVFTCSGLGHAKAQTNKGSRNRKLVNEGIEPKWTYQRAKIRMKQLSKTLAKSKSARCILDICNGNFLLRPCFKPRKATRVALHHAFSEGSELVHAQQWAKLLKHLLKTSCQQWRQTFWDRLILSSWHSFE